MSKFWFIWPLKPCGIRREGSRRILSTKSTFDVQNPTIAHQLRYKHHRPVWWGCCCPYGENARFGMQSHLFYRRCWHWKVSCCHQAWSWRRGNTVQLLMWKCPLVRIPKTGKLCWCNFRRALLAPILSTALTTPSILEIYLFLNDKGLYLWFQRKKDTQFLKKLETCNFT